MYLIFLKIPKNLNFKCDIYTIWKYIIIVVCLVTIITLIIGNNLSE